jgi:fucose 4-O-acetylase-like acetyltransferase
VIGNPTVRGLAIVVLIAGIVTALQLENILAALFFVVQIAFIVAIAWFLYRLWRERREEISMWSLRARLVFYGAALLALVNVAVAFAPPLDYPSTGLEAVGFFAVLAACVFSMWRVWRDEHTYGY